MSRLNEDAALLIQLHKAEARLKELESDKYKLEGILEMAAADCERHEVRIKELETERDDLLRLGNNHK